jgi:glycosyltransferase involved in cell wall biosynthesis
MTSVDGVTVVIPTIPIRQAWLGRATDSVDRQTLREFADVGVITSMDTERRGAAHTRNEGLERVTTDWVAFLDDDDEMMPEHLEKLLLNALCEKADVCYSLPKVIGPNGVEIPRQFDWGGGPLFDPDYLRRKAHIQTTCLVRTEWAKRVGGFEFIADETGAVNDDHGFFLKLLNAGARFHHLHEQTFIWHHHGSNTSGQPNRW